MKLSALLTLPACLVSTTYATVTAAAAVSTAQNEYSEHLHLKPLPGGALYAGFNFTATTPLSLYDAQHFRYFPRSLGQILQYTHTAELHLRFALGRWDDASWGSRPRSGLREGGNGVELWAWLEADSDGDAMGRWGDLVNSLSGLFCASLNFIDSGRTIRPVLSFDPEGTLDSFEQAKKSTTGQTPGKLELLHGMLPHEVVCTENLTPFLKLLPCKGKAGIASLLDGHKVFDANWQTMAIDVRPVCTKGQECQLEIQQTVDMVLDIARSSRPKDNPIPRPPAIEDVVCDENKPYNGHDTCYPKVQENGMEWSLSTIFGRPLKGSCPLSNPDAFDLTLEVPGERTVEVACNREVKQSTSRSGFSRFYRIPEGEDFDLRLPQQNLEKQLPLDHSPLFISRQITGYGAERGGMRTTLHNPHPHAQRIIYLESLPWFLRPYIHTLRTTGAKINNMYYKPLLDRQRGTHLELLLDVPAGSTISITYDFEKAVLRYTEYPPDANRGFDIAPAVIRVLSTNNTSDLLIRDSGTQSFYLRTTSLLLPLPTPDFSMPYNVIILTSTVIALGFGSIFNLLVRRFVLAEEVPVSPLATALRRVTTKAREAVGKSKRKASRGQGDGEKVVDGAKIAKANGKPNENRKEDR